MKAFAVLMLAAGLAAAQTNEIHCDVLHTLDGEALTNATVKRMNAIFAIVLFDGGGKKIAFTNLSGDIQKRFGFDPVKAQAELDLQARQKQEAKDKLAAQVKARWDAQNDMLFRIVDDKVFATSLFQHLHGRVSQVLTNGIVLQLYERIEQRHRYSSHLTENESMGIGYLAGPAGSYTTYSDVLRDKMVFIKCPFHGLAEGQDWSGLCLRTGTFSLLEADGNRRVLEKYDTGVSSVTKSDAVITAPAR